MSRMTGAALAAALFATPALAQLDAQFDEPPPPVTAEQALAALDTDGAWVVLENDGKRAWSDDYTNVIGAILENQR